MPSVELTGSALLRSLGVAESGLNVGLGFT
jgi:hypothetical protein